MSLPPIVARPLEELNNSRRWTLELAGGLGQGELDHEPAPGRWSVGEVLDHLARMEAYFRGLLEQLIERELQGDRPVVEITFAEFNPSPQFLPKARLKSLERPLGLLSSLTPFAGKELFARYRMVRMVTPDVGLPRKGSDRSALMDALGGSLAETISLLESHPDLDYRRMAVRHPFSGRTDVTQILTILALHERRHHRQISDIAKSRGFPGRAASYPAGLLGRTRWMVSLDRPGPAGPAERLFLGTLLRVVGVSTHAAVGSETRIARRELANTISTFRLFRLGAGLLPRSRRDQPLADLVADLKRADPFAGLWAAEGLGYHRAEAHDPATDALLGDEVAGSLPHGDLVPLHVGAGLALARRRLAAEVLPESEGSALRLLLDEIRLGSATGSAGVAIEAVGLLVRTLAPHRIPAFDAALRELDPDTRAWFWHGVGRALYFLFPRALYGDTGWARVAVEAPDEAALRPAWAGYVWALCLVNTGYPAVIETFLRRRGDGLDEEAFRHGLTGTSLVWQAWAGDDARLERRLASRPGAADVDWEDRVRQPLLSALEESAPSLAANRRVESLFLIASDPGQKL